MIRLRCHRFNKVASLDRLDYFKHFFGAKTQGKSINRSGMGDFHLPLGCIGFYRLKAISRVNLSIPEEYTLMVFCQILFLLYYFSGQAPERSRVLAR
jgi:hypothetical protein